MFMNNNQKSNVHDMGCKEGRPFLCWVHGTMGFIHQPGVWNLVSSSQMHSGLSGAALICCLFVFWLSCFREIFANTTHGAMINGLIIQSEKVKRNFQTSRWCGRRSSVLKVVHGWVPSGSHLPPGRNSKSHHHLWWVGGDGSGPLNCSTEKHRGSRTDQESHSWAKMSLDSKFYSQSWSQPDSLRIRVATWFP